MYKAGSLPTGFNIPGQQQLYKKTILFNSDPQPTESLEFNIAPLQQILVLLVASPRYFFADGSMETREAFLPVSVVNV